MSGQFSKPKIRDFPESFGVSAGVLSPTRPMSEIEMLCTEQEKAIEVLGVAIGSLESSLITVLAPDSSDAKSGSVGGDIVEYDIKTQLGDVLANRVRHLKLMTLRVESIINRLGI